MEFIFRGHTCAKIVGTIFLLSLITQTSASVYAQEFGLTYSSASATPAYAQAEKGLRFHSSMIANNLRAPSFEELRQAGFTLIGTGHGGLYSDSELNVTLRNWFKNVRSAGFRTFLQIQADYQNAHSYVLKAASLAVDVVELDELIDKLGFTEIQLLGIIDTGLTKNPNLQYIITEYTVNGITKAYEWTAKYPQVRVATDNYGDKSSIDLGIRLAQKFNKRPLVWLIFTPGSKDFDCYNSLDTWLSYAKERKVDAIFFKIDKSGDWQIKWKSVVGY